LLIASGSVRSEVDSRNKWGMTPLHFASRYGQVQVSQVLVDHGADVNAKDLEHWTPIHLSAANGLLGIAKLLLKRGADVHARNGDGQTGQAPYQILVASRSRDTAELLQECVARAD
jgi:ankyrin repeat protein